MAIDWDRIRRHRHAPDGPPPEWPSGVQPISTEGLTLFGLDGSGTLYFDGREVVLRKRLDLTLAEKVIAAAGALGLLLSGIAVMIAAL